MSYVYLLMTREDTWNGGTERSVLEVHDNMESAISRRDYINQKKLYQQLYIDTFELCTNWTKEKN